MKYTKLFILFSSACLLLFSSCASFINENTLMTVQNGMSKQEVVKLLGQPNLRRFDHEVEQWEYHRNIKLDNVIVLVEFENDMVSGMDSFSPASAPKQIVPQYSCPPSPTYDRPYSNVMSDIDFDKFYSEVKNKVFKDDQMKLISVGTMNGCFSCSQCAKMMSLYSFDDDRLKVLECFAPRIKDVSKADVILDRLSFISSQDKAKLLLRIR